MKAKNTILSLIILSQFCCTSLWFAGNGVATDLISYFDLGEQTLSSITSAVQFGFILGTLTFSLLNIVDRFSPSKVFFYSALLGAFFNGLITLEGNNLLSILLLRFLVGFFLAGIYPVGVKIASDYFKEGLGKALGYLVGALVIGTALPHLLKEFTKLVDWEFVILCTSVLSITGGLIIMLFVPDGPYRKSTSRVNFQVLRKAFKTKGFKIGAFGYFGHMWELYSFWAFVPIILTGYFISHNLTEFSIPLWSFIIIAIGGLSCSLAGWLTSIFKIEQIASISLSLSGVCCLLLPLIFIMDSPFIFLSFMLIWGMLVIADSPLFSTIITNNTKPEIRGSALTLVNCIGYAITIISIQCISYVQSFWNSTSVYSIMALGPIIGVFYLFYSLKNVKRSRFSN